MTLRFIVARILRELIELAVMVTRTWNWSARCTMRSEDGVAVGWAAALKCNSVDDERRE